MPAIASNSFKSPGAAAFRSPAAAFRSLAAAAALAASLCACNAKDPSQPKPPTPQAEAEHAAGVIPQSQLDAMNKAKDVEKVLQQGAQRSDPSE